MALTAGGPHPRPLRLAAHHRGDRWRARACRPDGRLDLSEGRWLVNPGAVGQPRDGDARAAWALVPPRGGRDRVPADALRRRGGPERDPRGRPAGRSSPTASPRAGDRAHRLPRPRGRARPRPPGARRPCGRSWARGWEAPRACTSGGGPPPRRSSGPAIRWPRWWAPSRSGSSSPRAPPRRATWRSPGCCGPTARLGRHIVASAVEHPATMAACRSAVRDGADLDLVPVDGEGFVDPAALAAAMREDTALVAVVHGQPDIGTLQDPAALVAAARRRRSPRAPGPRPAPSPRGRPDPAAFPCPAGRAPSPTGRCPHASRPPARPESTSPPPVHGTSAQVGPLAHRAAAGGHRGRMLHCARHDVTAQAHVGPPAARSTARLRASVAPEVKMIHSGSAAHERGHPGRGPRSRASAGSPHPLVQARRAPHMGAQETAAIASTHPRVEDRAPPRGRGRRSARGHRPSARRWASNGRQPHLEDRVLGRRPRRRASAGTRSRPPRGRSSRRRGRRRRGAGPTAPGFTSHRPSLRSSRPPAGHAQGSPSIRRW